MIQCLNRNSISSFDSFLSTHNIFESIHIEKKVEDFDFLKLCDSKKKLFVF